MWIERLMAGISHQHVLSYNPVFAGIAVGDQLEVFKKLSWKIVIVSFVVMASTYFGSAAISNIILSLKGMI